MVIQSPIADWSSSFHIFIRWAISGVHGKVIFLFLYFFQDVDSCVFFNLFLFEFLVFLLLLWKKIFFLWHGATFILFPVWCMDLLLSEINFRGVVSVSLHWSLISLACQLFSWHYQRRPRFFKIHSFKLFGDVLAICIDSTFIADSHDPDMLQSASRCAYVLLHKFLYPFHLYLSLGPVLSFCEGCQAIK